MMTKSDPFFHINFNKLDVKIVEVKKIVVLKRMTVECIWEDCLHTYTVPFSPNLRAMTEIVDYSTCPRCKRHRCPNLHDKVIVRCKHCPRPAMKAHMCIAHYMRDYKKRHKMVSGK